MKKILILIDCQNDFIDGTLRNEDAIKAVPNIVNKIKNEDYDYVIFTQDTHSSKYLETKEGEKLPVKHCIIGTNGHYLNDSIRDAVINKYGINYNCIRKPTFGSFDLVDEVSVYLESEDIPTEITVCGFCTDICVISNVLMLKAKFYNNAEIIVDASCCAGVTQESHKAALNVMKSCQINIINE